MKKEEVKNMSAEQIAEAGVMMTEVLDAIFDQNGCTDAEDMKEAIKARALAEAMMEIAQGEKMTIAGVLTATMLVLADVMKSEIQDGYQYDALHDNLLDCVERMLDEEVAPYAREQEAKKDAENENGNEGK